jgi:hypothetical protein
LAAVQKALEAIHGLFHPRFSAHENDGAGMADFAAAIAPIRRISGASGKKEERNGKQE